MVLSCLSNDLDVFSLILDCAFGGFPPPPSCSVVKNINDKRAHARFVCSILMRHRNNEASCCSSTVIVAAFAGGVCNALRTHDMIRLKLSLASVAAALLRACLAERCRLLCFLSDCSEFSAASLKRSIQSSTNREYGIGSVDR